MSSVVERPDAARRGRVPTLTRVRDRLNVTGVELILYGLLVVVAGAARFWDLGSRALHHDESLHAQFSWYMAEGLRDAFPLFTSGSLYHHDPMMHGTFLFHITAFTYLLFGDSDYTARIPPALFGTALVVMPYFFRDRLGRVGALTASAFLALSPTLLYFSRFQRNDIYVAVFTLAMVIAIWRYLDEGRARWLYVLAGALALSFTSKETTYLSAAVFLLAVDFMVASDLVDRWQGQSRWAFGRRVGAFALVAPVAWLVVSAWPLLRRWPFPYGKGWGLDPMPRSGHVLLVLGTLTLPQFAAGVQVPLERLGVDLAQPATIGPWATDREHVVGWATILALLAGTAAVGLAWRPRTWGIAFAVFFGLFAFFYTTMFTWVPEGIYSGFWRGLDYWLAQQGVERGQQPVFYYLMLLPVYEFLPLAVTLLGVGFYALRDASWRPFLLLGSLAAYSALVLGGPLAARPLVPTVALILAVSYAFHPDSFRRFLMFWLLGSLFAYSVAGEKMPWLLTHLALPLAVLAAVVVNDVVRWAVTAVPPRPRVGIGLVLAVAALGVVVALLLVERWYSGGRLALLPGAALAALVIAAYTGRAASPRWAAGAAAAGVVGLLAVLSVRAAYMAGYEHGDVPVELLVYTQTSPDLVRVRDRIDDLAEQTGEGTDLAITVDSTDSFSWPWAWYLRHYRNTGYPSLRGRSAPSFTPVMIVNASNAPAMVQYRGVLGEGDRFPHRWWFPEDYKRLTRRDFLDGLFRASRWRTWWDYWMWRKTPSPIGHIDAVAYFPGDAPGGAVGDEPLEPREENGVLTLGGFGVAPGAMNQPAGVALGPDGSIYVADAQNHRIQRFDSEGRFVAEGGGQGSAEGQFSEPWGLAVDDDGFVYVADTWNHRIQKLDPDLRYVTSWGTAVRDREQPGPYELYGPRDVAIGPDGNLLVADTGNKRVVRYSRDGEYLGEFGGAGEAPGRFNEPVGLAVTPDGGVLVADTWNGRVQRFDRSLSFVAEYAVRGWESADRLAKPYLTVLPGGRIALTAPAEGTVQILDASGAVLQVLDAPPGGESFLNPVGIEADSQGRLYVVDLGASRLRRFEPLP